MESNTRPTQGGESVSRGLHGVRERAGKNKQERFTALLHHGLRRAWRKLALSLPPVWPSRGEQLGRRPVFVFEAQFLPSMPLSTLHPEPRGAQGKT